MSTLTSPSLTRRVSGCDNRSRTGMRTRRAGWCHARRPQNRKAPLEPRRSTWLEVVCPGSIHMNSALQELKDAVAGLPASERVELVRFVQRSLDETAIRELSVEPEQEGTLETGYIHNTPETPAKTIPSEISSRDTNRYRVLRPLARGGLGEVF